MSEVSETNCDIYDDTLVSSLEEQLSSPSYSGSLLVGKLNRLNMLLSRDDAYDRFFGLTAALPVGHAFDEDVDQEPQLMGLSKRSLKKLLAERSQVDQADQAVLSAMKKATQQATVFNSSSFRTESPLSGSIEWLLKAVRENELYDVISDECAALFLRASFLLLHRDFDAFDEALNNQNKTSNKVSDKSISYLLVKLNTVKTV